MALLPVEEVLQRLLDGAAPIGAETVPVHEAAFRVLAGPLTALRTQPPFDASAMDGYAVRAADVATLPARLKVVGQAPAGRRYPGRLGAGEAVRIFTGAPVPEGADAILIQEHARALGNDAVEAIETVSVGRHIRPAGLDFETGAVLLEAGRVLDPAALSLAASANHPQLAVVKKPLVAIVATGDELLPPGSTPGPDQIIASNSYGVAAVVEASGARSLDLGIVPDDREMIAAAIGVALGSAADIIVTLGGASVGEHDLVREVLAKEGMELDFWRIAMRPGKPLMFGRLGHTRVVGLPGNPVASLICSHLFLKALVARLAGREHRAEVLQAYAGAAMPPNDQREDYVRAHAALSGGRLMVVPFPVQDSSMLLTLAAANALIVREPFAPALAPGDTCKIVMLR
jgi:molybdopterin molybdotransferase